MAIGSRGSMRARFRRGWPSTSTCAKQPSGSVMIASRGAQRRDLAHRQRALLLVGELVADELLGLEHVRRDDVGLGAHRLAQRLAVGVDHGRHVQPLQLADQRRVESGSTPRGSEPANTTIAAPRAR